MEIWNAVQPCLPASIIRTLAGKTITTSDELKQAITATYGSHSNIFQRLEEFFSKRKSYKTSFPQYQSELEASLTSIATIHKEWLRRRASLSRNGSEEQKVFAPSYDDCLELINFLKILTEVRTQDESLFRAISIELTSITSPAQLATRAEQIRQQVHSNSGFNAAHRGSPRDSPRNSRPGSSDRRKKNKNADKGDKDDKNANNSKKRGDKDKKSNGSRRSHVGSKPSKSQQQYGAHYSSCNQEIPSDEEDGSYQLRDPTQVEDEYFSDASEASAYSDATSKN
ncbi:Oidioi.mRNA.OKI2018_I69.chr2.g6419.t1.cds [Oikopleura dioica]|uniref:Oidioi.mRNA.OKI2018_I69.chr2.g6419.t1.cds n=1 Tax=Oikopleura dioica TaxID=34765 RepID=A0ABN7T3Y2_OIKDI|nr:Oidioi.mRNA.OKI2018_I69.chr2.g6419.t1.cds [Oikopleura dioica]